MNKSNASRLAPNRHLLLAVCLAASLVAATVSCKRQEPPPPVVAPPAAPVIPVHASVYDMIADGDSIAFDAWITNQPNVNVRGDEQVTPLIRAAQLGRAMFVRALLERGADLTMVDLRGRTALHAAAQEGRAEIARQLLEAGADPSVTDYDGNTAQQLAAAAGYQQTADLLEAAQAARIHPKRPEPSIEEPAGEIPEAVLLSTDFRAWTSASGDRVEAAFIQCVFDTVILQQPDGNMLRIGINRLSGPDQVMARQLSGVDPHTLARVRPARTANASRPRDSLAARIGDNPGWTTLEECRLLRNSANDGDSFHVMHDGKEYIFRLYLVDAAETDDEFPERIREQAHYFDLNEDQVEALGREAQKFTGSVLAGTAFTVYTRWEDARGNSSLPRYYALVSTPMGDLDELLAQEGLVRIYGMPVSGDGNRKQERLRKLEQEAKQNRVGAWRKHGDVVKDQ